MTFSHPSVGVNHLVASTLSTMAGSIPDEGWYVDPYGTHEQRWISQGRPTSLVRDGDAEAKDPPPDRPAPEPFVPVPSDSTELGWRDMRRADDVDRQEIPGSGRYGDAAMDANVAYDNAQLGGIPGSLIRAPAPSGLPSNAPLTPFERKMKQRATRKRWADRWNRWFGRTRRSEGNGT